MSSDTDTAKLARLRWQCRRGSLELDLIFQRFFEQHYPQLNTLDRERFARVLELDDPVLLAYMNGIAEPDEGDLNELIIRIRESY